MTASGPTATADPRVQQTRMALFQAFRSLVLSREYDAIRVADIIARAGVSRSTFYHHYRNKDDILAGSMGGLLSVLAAAATGAGKHEDVRFVLQHFWENRQFGRVILNGQAARRVAGALADSIERSGHGDESRRVTTRLQAVQMAEGQLGAIRAWLQGGVRCTAHDLADQFMRFGMGFR
ncbi:MAG: TetR/AcrR family transcriptional regulator [Xanthomonadales bacterium]|nr:TetR/AcrR family transcriptional regulator [Xanthomonadales bacterium]